MYFFFGGFALLYILIRLLLVSGTIRLYKEVIAIQKPLRKVQFQYPLRNLVNYKFVEDEYFVGEMQFTLTYKGSVIRRKHSIQLDTSDANKLKSRITELQEKLK